MQNLALISGVVAVLSLGLIDTHIDKNLFRLGKISLAISALIFVVTQGMVLMG